MNVLLWRVPGLFAALCLALGCASVPDVNGRPATACTTEEILAWAQDRFEHQEHARAADLAEYVLRTDFEHAGIEKVRFLAAEARFQAGDLEEAFVHYRRLLEENRFTPFAPDISRRVWAIGKELAERKGRFMGDLSASRDVGLEALTFYVTHFPKDSYADDAWKELAEAQVEDHQHQGAADIYERLVREYPGSEWCDLALYEGARAYRALSRGSAFDIDPLLTAHAALRRYLACFPEGNFAEQARAELLEIEEEVGRHELEIAEYYRQRGSEYGERLHLANAAGRFPQAAAAAAAASRLAGLPEIEGCESLELLRPREERPPWRRQPSAGAADPGAQQNDRR